MEFVNALQQTMNRRSEDGLVLFAFDLLRIGSVDWTEKPYVARNRRLAALVAGASIARLYHSEYFEDGAALLRECGKRSLEGIVSKRRDSTYRAGRSGDWIKVGCPAWREANRERYKLFERA